MGNTVEFVKAADGCAQPWLSYVASAITVQVQVATDNEGTVDIGSSNCPAGSSTCNLPQNFNHGTSWSNACEGYTCNNYQWHLQSNKYPVTATLNY